MKLRMFFALLLGRAVRLASRLLRRGGTDMPGRLALRVCPNLLALLAKDVVSVAVTGTNGKTTSARMIEQAFLDSGLKTLANRSGANLLSGITTEFIMNADLRGRPRCDHAVIETDEAASKLVFPQLRPKLVVVTNLFRDQLDRYGEVTHTLSNIREAIRSVPEATLCLNADCSLTASLAEELPNRVVWFGVEKGAVPNRPKPELSDATHCIRCKGEYEYEYITYGHLGGFYCPHCGYRRHKADIAVTEVVEQKTEGSSVVLSLRGERRPMRISLPALYNVYNAAGAVAAITEAGLSADCAISALTRFRCGFGRMEKLALGKAGARMMLVKNPAGCNQVLEFMQELDEPFILVVCLNDRHADGTDVSWIWDAEFETLSRLGNRLNRVIVSGDRAADMRVRIKYAGVPEGRITLEKDYEKLVDELQREEKAVLLMPTYTAMLELRQIIIRRVGGSEFWE
ncbi:MAG: MurT ligase domain-containing protein [Oscillospiraceae bacterium]|nr:MurT ligase domain-containing protein [Oscillospiraceae bacterium]